MRGREYCNQKMSEISQPVDVEKDPFVNLFSKDDPAEPEDGETVFVRRLKQARSQKIEESLNQVRDEKVDTNLGVSRTIYALPAVVLGFCGVFLAGFYGGNFAGDQIRNSNAGLPITVSAPTPAAVMGNNTMKPKIAKKTGSTIIAKAHNSGVSSFAKTKVVGLVPSQDNQVVSAMKNRGQSSTESLIPATRAGAVALLLVAGHRLEKGGDISGARKKFTQAALAGNSSGALALARSYDHRSNLTGASAADSKLARKWYEKWFLMAIEKGEISPRIRYDRLLKGIEKT